jgi:protein SCO1/2
VVRNRGTNAADEGVDGQLPTRDESGQGGHPTGRGVTRRWRLPAWALAALLASCQAEGAQRTWRPGDYRGAVLAAPFAEPDFTLTATDGRSYDFKRETASLVALLFFGYTHCPDVCPLHMANIAAVLRRLPSEVSRRVRVVFVTVDPARDTPRVLRAWLDNFDPAFVGLRGPLDSVNRIQHAFHMFPTVIERLPNGDIAVGHEAAVIALIGDSVRVLYPFGTEQGDWVHDLPELVAAIPRTPGTP